MRLLYAVQFEVISSEASGRDISERVFQSLESWICNWYRYRKNLTVSFPSASGILNPCETHELIITREISRSNEASHLSVSWTYPGDNDGNLLWHSKCDISQYGDLTEFSFQLLLESLQFYITPVEFSLRRPRVIATLLRQFVCTHGDTRLSIEPQGLSAAAIPQFVRTRLLSRNRRTPVVVVSRTTESGKWLVDPADLADHLAGIAEVFILDDKWAGYALIDELGKSYACYNGAIRLYWPDFDPRALPYSPVYIQTKIHNLEGKLVDIIFRQLAAISAFRFVPGPVALDAIQALQEEKNKDLEVIKNAARDRGDYEALLRLADVENTELLEQLGKLKEENAEFRARLQLSEENIRAMWQTQESELEVAVADSSPETDSEPESVEEAVHMAQEDYADTLVFLDSAVESAEDSPYRHPERVSESLLAMHEVCQAWRQSLRSKTPMGSLEQQFSSRGFIYKARESMTSRGKWGEEYEATYQGRKVPIEQHLALGKGKPDACLRIHFYTDEKDQKYVIAHVGRHKTNTST